MARRSTSFMVLCLLLASVVARGQIDATFQELEVRYGTGREVKAPPPATEAYRFASNGLRIQAEMIDDRCVRIAYLPGPETGWTAEVIKKILDDNTGDGQWGEAPRKYFNPQLAARGKPRKAWERSDKQAFAHLGQPVFDVISKAYIEAVNTALAEAEDRRKFRRLARKVRGNDFEESLQALQEIGLLGAAYRDEVAELTLDLLKANQRQLERILSRVDKNDVASRQALAARRRAALDHIKVLTKDKESLALAHKNQKELSRDLTQGLRELDGRWATFQLLQAALVQHERLLKILRQLETTKQKYIDAKAEAALAASTHEAYGATPAEITSFPSLSAEPPSNAVLHELWRYNFNRKIEAYNQELMRQRLTSRQEEENLEAVNNYREALGLRRLELDARLLQSARRHSKQMVDLEFFSHESPKEETRTFLQRIKRTGYPRPGGENIAYGKTDGEAVFWMWFDSPGHHQNMAKPRYRAIGIGKWQSHWTQNFGTAPLLVFASETEREAAGPKGDILSP